MVLFILALLMVTACIIGKALAVALIQKYEGAVRRNQQKLFEMSGRVKVAQQKYVIAQKTEGIAAHKVSTLKYRLQGLEEQFAQVELEEIKHDLEKQREVTLVLDQVVRQSLRQVGIVDEERVQQVIGVIANLIDLEKHGNSEDLVDLIREKLVQMKSGNRGGEEETPPVESATAPPALSEAKPASPPEPQPSEDGGSRPAVQAAPSILL